MTDPASAVTGSAVVAARLSKTYRVYGSPWGRLIEGVTGRPRHRPFHALRDVSFDVPRGEALALIGENGAGKSTLLKIMAGITAPSEGAVEVHGKVASILELGSGFHPEFTGRQNIALNAALLGLGPDEVAARLPEIVAFSELGDFIDQPVKAYSTGMAMRLGFSIAMQVDPDVLIIDEALSVGDGYFQKKCMDRIRRFLDEGRTLLFCSHAMYYVSAFCPRALWMRQGQIEQIGPTDAVIAAYESFLQAKARPAASTAGADHADAPDARSDAPSDDATQRPGPVRLRGVTVRALDAGDDASSSDAPRIARGGGIVVDVTWTVAAPATPTHVGVGLNRASDGIEVCAFTTRTAGVGPFVDAPQHRVRLVLPNLPLIKGAFTLYVFVLDDAGLHIYDQRIVPDAFVVEADADGSYRFGLVELAHRWEADDRATPVAAASMAAMAARAGE
ncbi:MAG: ABC transporter ATP-binding protein [Acidobacteriota bacterium]